MVTTLAPLFGATTGGLCFAAPAVGAAAALPIELPVTAPTAEAGFVTPPSVAGFVTAETDAAAPPMTGAGFEAPPIALCFVLTGPPSAFCAREGRATVSATVPIDITSSIILIIVLFFMRAILPVAERISARSPIFIRAGILSQAIEI